MGRPACSQKGLDRCPCSPVMAAPQEGAGRLIAREDVLAGLIEG